MQTIKVFIGVLLALVTFQILNSMFAVYQQREIERLEYEAEMNELDETIRMLDEETKKLEQNSR